MISAILLLVAIIFNIYNQNLIQTVAETREYNTEKNNLNVTLPNAGMKAIDFNLENGEEYEIVYSIQVKEGLPIDLWLVNEDNYLLLISDVNFLYYIDGSDKEVPYAKKIVSLKEEGLYKLVLANIYNNQTVTANVIYELRSFQGESEESPEISSILFYPLVITVVVLGILGLYLLMSSWGLKRELHEGSKKSSSKKKKKKRKNKKYKQHQKQKPKVEKNDMIDEEISDKEILDESREDEIEKKPKGVVVKQKKPKVTEKVISGFCGNCGEAVSTRFCKSCGEKV